MYLSVFRENCDEKMEQFLKRCFYHSGQYDSEQNFSELDKKLKEHEVMCHFVVYLDHCVLVVMRYDMKICLKYDLEMHRNSSHTRSFEYS